MGCGQKVPGWTVMRNCASGMQALDSAIDNILAGRSSLVLAGGVDALSRAPLLYADAMVLWFSRTGRGEDRRPARRALRAVCRVRSLLAPVIGIMKRAHRSDRRTADGPDRGEPRVPLRHHARARWMRSRCAATSACSRAGRRLAARTWRRRRSCRSTTATATLYALDDGVRARLDGREPREAEAVLRPQVRQRHRRATARRSPTARRGWCSPPRKR